MVDSALGINAADIETETSADDGVESSVSDAAQQLSAWAWVTTLCEPALGSGDPCMGLADLA